MASQDWNIKIGRELVAIGDSGCVAEVDFQCGPRAVELDLMHAAMTV